MGRLSLCRLAALLLLLPDGAAPLARLAVGRQVAVCLVCLIDFVKKNFAVLVFFTAYYWRTLWLFFLVLKYSLHIGNHEGFKIDDYSRTTDVLWTEVKACDNNK